MAESKTNLTKEHLGLSGEYYVAAELCRRGHYAQITLGNHKKTDILLISNNIMQCISVKSKQRYEWAKVTGISGDNDFIVFVDFQNHKIDERPDFYVLSTSDWKRVIKKIKNRKIMEDENYKIDDSNTLVWEPREDNEKGWRGCAIKVDDVKKYKDCWPSVPPTQKHS